jgi:hypothetical protein
VFADDRFFTDESSPKLKHYYYYYYYFFGVNVLALEIYIVSFLDCCIVGDDISQTKNPTKLIELFLRLLKIEIHTPALK